jgi:hypothetical protein
VFRLFSTHQSHAITEESHEELSKEVDINKLIASAESGSSQAQKELGNVYYYGKGTMIDKEKAVYWWEKAANQENVAAQYNLGVFYLGCDSVQCVAQAMLWLQKAAKNGDKDAREQLQIISQQKSQQKIEKERLKTEERLWAEERRKERTSRCVLKPNTFVFNDYEDLMNYRRAIARGDDQDFLFDKYTKAKKIRSSLQVGVGDMNTVKVIKVSGDIAMIKDVSNRTYFVPKHFLECPE